MIYMLKYCNEEHPVGKIRLLLYSGANNALHRCQQYQPYCFSGMQYCVDW